MSGSMPECMAPDGAEPCVDCPPVRQRDVGGDGSQLVGCEQHRLVAQGAAGKETTQRPASLDTTDRVPRTGWFEATARAEQGREQLLALEHEARTRAESADQLKDEFVATASHELRGPLTDAQREDLSRIRRNQRHLLGLINDVLNFAKLETGNVRYEIADVPLREAVEGGKVQVNGDRPKRARPLQLGDEDLPGNVHDASGVVRALEDAVDELGRRAPAKIMLIARDEQGNEVMVLKVVADDVSLQLTRVKSIVFQEPARRSAASA